MRTGLLYFLRIDIVSVISRFTFVFLLLIVSKLPRQGLALPMAIALMVITFVLGLFHVHSGKYMQRIIKNSEEEFDRDFRKHHGISEAVELDVVRSFSRDEKLPLSRTLDGEKIYPHLVILGYYKLLRHTVVQVRVKSLIQKDVVEDFYFTVQNGKSLEVELKRISAEIVQYEVSLPSVDGKRVPIFPMKADFHLREFLNAVGVDSSEI